MKPGKVYSGRAGGRGSLLQRIRLKKLSVPTPARHSRGFPRQPPDEEPARTFFIPYPTIPVPKSTPGVIFPWLAGPNTQQNKGKGGNAAPSGPRAGAQSCFCSPRWGADPGGEAPRSQPLPSLTPQQNHPASCIPSRTSHEDTKLCRGCRASDKPAARRFGNGWGAPAPSQHPDPTAPSRAGSAGAPRCRTPLPPFPARARQRTCSLLERKRSKHPSGI